MSVVVPKRGVFPMHMTPFESYMFVDDSVKYPMTFIVEFEFSGRVDRAAFQDSINQALIRHSLLRSFIQPAKQNRDCWVAPESYDSRVIWLGLDEAIEVEGASEFINLREEIGVRCWCQHDDTRAVMTFAFHHAAVDGIGAYQFLGDVLWFYAAQTGTVDTKLPELPEKALRQRLKSTFGPDAAAFNEPFDEPERFAQPWQSRLGQRARLTTGFRRFIHTRSTNRLIAIFASRVRSRVRR